VEAGEYYGAHTQETSVNPDKKDKIIEALVKQGELQAQKGNYVGDLFQPMELEESRPEIVEVYMMVGGRSGQKLEEDENRVYKKEADSPEFKEEIFELSIRPTSVISYDKLGTAYRRSLEYVGLSKSYGNTYQQSRPIELPTKGVTGNPLT
ncbi:9117_t:CDS:2, partial [Racocetra fulgida]